MGVDPIERRSKVMVFWGGNGGWFQGQLAVGNKGQKKWRVEAQISIPPNTVGWDTAFGCSDVRGIWRVNRHGRTTLNLGFGFSTVVILSSIPVVSCHLVRMMTLSALLGNPSELAA